MATPFQLVSGDAQRALEVFSLEFDMALSVVDPETMWGRMFGLHNSSRNIRTTYPVPVSAAGYVPRKGDDKLRSLFERSLSVTPKEFQDGFAEKAIIVEAPDFIGWMGEPARIARETLRFPNKLVAEMLNLNANLNFYRDETLGTDLSIALFADNHPVNIFETGFGTFDNNHNAVAIDADMLSAAKTRFRTRKGPNGEVMGLRVTTMLVPAALEQTANDFLESDNLILALQNVAGTENVSTTFTNNRHKSTVELVVADELLDDDIIYLLDAGSGVFPWVLQDGGAPEEITFDKTDSLFKNEGKIGAKFILLAAAVGALPHGIERITITG